MCRSEMHKLMEPEKKKMYDTAHFKLVRKSSMFRYNIRLFWVLLQRQRLKKCASGGRFQATAAGWVGVVTVAAKFVEKNWGRIPCCSTWCIPSIRMPQQMLSCGKLPRRAMPCCWKRPRVRHRTFATESRTFFNPSWPWRT